MVDPEVVRILQRELGDLDRFRQAIAAYVSNQEHA